MITYPHQKTNYSRQIQLNCGIFCELNCLLIVILMIIPPNEKRIYSLILHLPKRILVSINTFILPIIMILIIILPHQKTNYSNTIVIIVSFLLYLIVSSVNTFI